MTPEATGVALGVGGGLLTLGAAIVGAFALRSRRGAEAYKIQVDATIDLVDAYKGLLDPLKEEIKRLSSRVQELEKRCASLEEENERLKREN